MNSEDPFDYQQWRKEQFGGLGVDDILAQARTQETGQNDVAHRTVPMANMEQDTVPGVECDPGVCGGDPYIHNTRIPVWVLVGYRRLGMSDAEILRSYPTLRAEDLANAWAYEQSHRKEIDRQIADNEDA